MEKIVRNHLKNLLKKVHFVLFFPYSYWLYCLLSEVVWEFPMFWEKVFSFHLPHLLEDFLKPVVHLPEVSIAHHSWQGELSFMIISTLCVVLVVLCTGWLYLKKSNVVSNFKNKNLFLFNLFNQGFLSRFYLLPKIDSTSFKIES